MRTYFWTMIIALSVIPFSSYAIDIPSDYPRGLLYKGQPIDPLCFDPMETANSKTLLSTCGIQAEPNEKKGTSDPKLLAKGYVGFDYNWVDENGKSASQGYSYYKAYKNNDGSFTIYSISSGGGSGQFSSLILAKRNGDTLELATLAGGDRCNNGIFDVKQENGTFTYKMNMTPYDFLDLSKQNPRHLEAYTDLAACAACCVGTATISRGHQPTAAEKLITVNLHANDLNQIDQGKYQVCFNRLMTDAKKQGSEEFTPAALNKLMQKFNTQCV